MVRARIVSHCMHRSIALSILRMLYYPSRTDTSSATTPWIAFISCDDNPAVIPSTSDIFSLAEARGAVAAVSILPSFSQARGVLTACRMLHVGIVVVLLEQSKLCDRSHLLRSRNIFSTLRHLCFSDTCDLTVCFMACIFSIYEFVYPYLIGI